MTYDISAKTRTPADADKIIRAIRFISAEIENIVIIATPIIAEAIHIRPRPLKTYFQSRRIFFLLIFKIQRKTITSNTAEVERARPATGGFIIFINTKFKITFIAAPTAIIFKSVTISCRAKKTLVKTAVTA